MSLRHTLLLSIQVATLTSTVALFGCMGVLSTWGASESDPLTHDDDSAPGPEGFAQPWESSGPMTFVVETTEVSTDTLCDLDGDGHGDNVLSQLGGPQGEFVGGILNGALQASIDEGFRLVVHMPWVDDLEEMNDESTSMLVFEGQDTDDPRDPSDDFEGDEAFFAARSGMDHCGEPLYTLDASLDRGDLRGHSGGVPLKLGAADLILHGAQATGHVSADAEAASITLCGALMPDELAAWAGDILGVPADLSLLEVLVAGGASFGLANIGGATPNIDRDGDGLERYVLDEHGHVSTCIDGDRTVIRGRNCWQDERMVDGFALVVTVHAARAAFAGREPGWETPTIECDRPPVTTSGFDPS